MDVGPTCSLRHPEDVFRKVFLGVFRVGEFVSAELIVHSLEGLRDVFEKNQAKRDVFVLGWLQPSTHFISRFEKIGRKIKVSAACIFGHIGSALRLTILFFMPVLVHRLQRVLPMLRL